MTILVRRIAIAAAGLALVAGIILLIVQAPMAAQRDSAAFEEAVAALHPDLERDISPPSLEHANRAFFDLVRDQDTGKNRLFDLGIALLAVSALALAGLLNGPLRRYFMKTHGFWLVALLSGVVTAVFWIGLTQSFIVVFERFEVPPWADSLAIPLAGVTIITPLVFIALMGLAGLPHIARTPKGSSLLAPPKGIAGLLATLVYLLIAAALIWLAFSFAVEPAGWLLAPAALIAAWLMLHARAVAVA